LRVVNINILTYIVVIGGGILILNLKKTAWKFKCMAPPPDFDVNSFRSQLNQT